MRRVSMLIGVVLAALIAFVTVAVVWRLVVPDALRSPLADIFAPAIAAVTAGCAWVLLTSGRSLP